MVPQKHQSLEVLNGPPKMHSSQEMYPPGILPVVNETPIVEHTQTEGGKWFNVATAAGPVVLHATVSAGEKLANLQSEPIRQNARMN